MMRNRKVHCGKRGANDFCQKLCAFRLNSRQKNHKFFSAPTADTCLRSVILDRTPRYIREFQNDSIPFLMATGIVHLLKKVDIVHQQRELFACFLENFYAFLDTALDFSTVQKLCHAVRDRHFGELPVRFFEFYRRSVNKGREAVDHRDLSGELFVLHFKMHVQILRTFTQSGDDKSHVVLIQVPVGFQEFARGIKARSRSNTLKRERFLTDFVVTPVRATCGARENLDLFRLEFRNLFSVLLNTFKNRPRITVSNSRVHILFNIRSHRQRTVFVARDRRSQNIDSMVSIEERKFKSIAEEVFVVRYIQILVVSVISGAIVEFLQNAAIRLGHLEFTAKRFPTRDECRHHIQIFTAEQ